MYCSRCGTIIRPGSAFCMNCGAPVPSPVPDGAGTPSSQPKKRPRRWLVTVAAVLCPLLVLGAVLGAVAIFSSEGGGSGGEEGEAVDLVTGRVETSGSPVEVARQVIPASGGTLTVKDAGSPLKGMALEVPAGSYPDGREFSISESTITGTTFGDDFNPVLPLIDIDNGGDYSEQVMLLKLPVVETGDDFYSAFFYDEESGELEGIPVASSDSGGLTLATRHFSKKASQRSNHIIVLGQSRESLQQRTRKGIWVRFRPENDGWPFENSRNYVARDHMCFGMSLSAMWYFSEKKKKGDAPALYNAYNNGTPGFAPDDEEGIKLSTVVQQDEDWNKYIEITKASMNSSDSRNYLAIANDFYETGKPVLVDLTEKPGAPGGAHVVVAYKIQGDHVFVYDSNHPGKERSIIFKDGKFQAYEGFQRIMYIGTWSLVPNKVAERWKELESGTIGDDLFPKYELSFYDDKGVELDLLSATSKSTSSSTVKIKIKAANANPSVNFTFTVYKGTEKALDVDTNTYSLDVGTNKLGLLIEAQFSDYDWAGWGSVVITRTEEEVKRRTATELRRTYYSTGELYSEYYSYFDENGQEVNEGPWKVYLQSGVLSHEANYTNGKLNGLETIYFDNGKPDRSWTYKDGKREGTMTRYRRDGTIEYTCEYSDDSVVPGSDKYY